LGKYGKVPCQGLVYERTWQVDKVNPNPNPNPESGTEVHRKLHCRKQLQSR